MESNLKVVEKMKYIQNRLYPVLKNFPRTERYEMVSRIKGTTFEIMRSLLLGETVKSLRKQHFQNAQGELLLLKILIETSKENKFISVGFYEDIDLRLTEVNKMIGSLLRKI